MKKFFAVIICALAWSAASQAQTASINIDAGSLRNSTGSTVVPTGGLLQLLASPSGTFGAPTTSSYTSGDNILLASFAMNMIGGVGETNNSLNGLALSNANYTLTTGEKLILRFYPSLTLAAMPSAPTLGTTFGQVRSDSVEFGSAGGVANETAWVVPSSGAQVGFEYVTASNGGTAAYTNASAYATGIVVGVPEPSTTGLIGGLAVGVAGLAKLRRRRLVS